MLNQQNLSEQQRLFGHKLYQLLLDYAKRKRWLDPKLLAERVSAIMLEAVLLTLSTREVGRIKRGLKKGGKLDKILTACKWVRKYELELVTLPPTTENKAKRRDAKKGLLRQQKKLDGMSVDEAEQSVELVRAQIHWHKEAGSIRSQTTEYLLDAFGEECIDRVLRAVNNYRGERLKHFPGDYIDFQEIKTEQTLLLNLRDAFDEPDYQRELSRRSGTLTRFPSWLTQLTYAQSYYSDEVVEELALFVASTYGGPVVELTEEGRSLKKRTESVLLSPEAPMARRLLDMEIDATEIWWPIDKRKKRWRDRIVIAEELAPTTVDESKDLVLDKKPRTQKLREFSCKIKAVVRSWWVEHVPYPAEQRYPDEYYPEGWFKPGWKNKWREYRHNISDEETHRRLDKHIEIERKLEKQKRSDPTWLRPRKIRETIIRGSNEPKSMKCHPDDSPWGNGRCPVYPVDSAADVDCRRKGGEAGRDPETGEEAEDTGSSFTFEGTHTANSKLRSMWWARDRHDNDVGEKDLKSFWLRDRYKSVPPHPPLGDEPVRTSWVDSAEVVRDDVPDVDDIDLDATGEYTRQFGDDAPESPDDIDDGLPLG